MDNIDFVREYPLIDVYSIFNAIIFASIFSALFYIVLRKTSWMIRLGLRPLLVFFFLSIFRLLLPVELPFSRIIGSEKILPKIQRVMNVSLVHIGGYDLQVRYVLFFLWMVGTVFLLVRLIVQWIYYIKRVSKYPKLSTEMMDDLKTWIPDFCGEVRVVEKDVVPHVSGFFHSIIFIPSVDYSVQDFRLLVLHEWQHIQNRDQWSKLLCYLLCCLFWWNPFMWMLKGKLDQLLEVRCDFSVLRKLKKSEQVDYYSMLLNAYRSSSRWSIPEGTPALASDYCHDVVIQRFHMGKSFSTMEKQSKKVGIAFSVLIIVMFCLSYCVLIQPRDMGPDVAENGNEIHTGLPKGTYLTPNEDGTYTCHSGTESGIVEDITVEPFLSLPIVEEK